MKPVIFISYSKERSEHMAIVLWRLLRKVFPRTKIYLSIGKMRDYNKGWDYPESLHLTDSERAELELYSTDGGQWDAPLREKLTAARLLICCLTPENLRSQWIYYEAGWMQYMPGKGKLERHIPFELVKGKFRKECEGFGPFGMTNAIYADRAGLRELCHKIHAALGFQGQTSNPQEEDVDRAANALDEIKLMPASGPTSLPLLFKASHRSDREPAFTAWAREVIMNDVLQDFLKLVKLSEPDGDNGKDLFTRVGNELKRMIGANHTDPSWRIFAICGDKGFLRPEMESYYRGFQVYASIVNRQLACVVKGRPPRVVARTRLPLGFVHLRVKKQSKMNQAIECFQNECVVSRVFVELDSASPADIAERAELIKMHLRCYGDGVRAFTLTEESLLTLRDLHVAGMSEFAAALRKRCGVVLFINIQHPGLSFVYFHENGSNGHYCRFSKNKLIVSHFAEAMVEVLKLSVLNLPSGKLASQAHEKQVLQERLEKYQAAVKKRPRFR